MCTEFCQKKFELYVKKTLEQKELITSVIIIQSNQRLLGICLILLPTYFSYVYTGIYFKH